jgi:hypothetical protein
MLVNIRVTGLEYVLVLTGSEQYAEEALLCFQEYLAAYPIQCFSINIDATKRSVDIDISAKNSILLSEYMKNNPVVLPADWVMNSYTIPATTMFEIIGLNRSIFLQGPQSQVRDVKYLLQDYFMDSDMVLIVKITHVGISVSSIDRIHEEMLISMLNRRPPILPKGWVLLMEIGGY